MRCLTEIIYDAVAQMAGYPQINNKASPAPCRLLNSVKLMHYGNAAHTRRIYGEPAPIVYSLQKFMTRRINKINSQEKRTQKVLN